MNLGYRLVSGGGVPGGHYVIDDGKRKPFVTPTREFNSIPLAHTDVVIDIGAYVGTYAIRCSRFPVATVVAYEPTPQTCEILRLTQTRNLFIRQAAVVADANTDEVTLFVSRGIGVTNSVVPSKSKDPVKVPAVAYAEAIRNATIVKIDVEGAEYSYPIAEVIPPTLRAFIIDFHPVGADWIAKAERIIEGIERRGFHPVIRPKWDCGWSRAGSWVRLAPEQPTRVCEELLQGEFCCGCGEPIHFGERQKSLCVSCWDRWSYKHRLGFHRE